MQFRSALTLVEILIALTMTLIVLGAMMTAFKYASEEMQQGRALMELSSRARSVEDYLRSDLASVTVEPRVYTGATEPNGYLECVEGPIRDNSHPAGSVNSYLGDCDDILAMTIRSKDGVLFRGRNKPVLSNGNGGADMTLNNPTIIESSLAEVAWFTTINDNDIAGGFQVGLLAPQNIDSVDFDDSVRVHRRVLLIRPNFAGWDPVAGAPLPAGQLANNLSLREAYNFIRNNDISLRIVQDGSVFDLFANSLQDLAVRKNRFAHTPDRVISGIPIVNFPNNLTFTNIQNSMASDDDNNTPYAVDSVAQAWTPLSPLLTDVAGFDLKVYSPNAAVNIDNTANIVVEPGDVGYNEDDTTVDAGVTNTDLQTLGAYVDLGYSRFFNADLVARSRDDEWFAGNALVNNYSFPTNTNIWDTWTPLYEHDGIDQDGNAGVDQGSNGVNDASVSTSPVIDDPGERETVAPYAQPIRGLKVTLRLVEKTTKQVHQTSVIQSFVPE